MELSLHLPPSNCTEINKFSGQSLHLPGKIPARRTLQCRDFSVSRNVSLVTKVGGDGSRLCCQALQGNPGVDRPALPEDGLLKAVIFDIDGTLCDSDPLHFRAFEELFQEIGFQGGEPINEEFFAEHISGRDIIEVMNNICPEWDQDKCDKFMRDKEARFCSLATEQLKPIEGLETLCQWIKEHHLQCAAVTNAPRENAEHMISIIGLTDFFDTIVVGSECARSKPFPDPYLKAIQHIGLSPEEAFVFEDSPTGMRAAVTAGLATVGVATRISEDALLEAGASFVISNFKDPRLRDSLKHYS